METENYKNFKYKIVKNFSIFEDLILLYLQVSKINSFSGFLR